MVAIAWLPCQLRMAFGGLQASRPSAFWCRPYFLCRFVMRVVEDMEDGVVWKAGWRGNACFFDDAWTRGVALGITLAKLPFRCLSAMPLFSYRFPFRNFCFGSFYDANASVEARIVTTYEVVANLDLLNQLYGVTLAIICQCDGNVFLLSAVLFEIPGNWFEAARWMALGWRSFLIFCCPLSRTNYGAPLFCWFYSIYWFGNKYLWPLWSPQDDAYLHLVMSIKRMLWVIFFNFLKNDGRHCVWIDMATDFTCVVVPACLRCLLVGRSCC